MAVKEIPLEKAFEQLEEAISKLEQEDITLEETFMVYQEGMKLLKQCNTTIDKVEKKVMQISNTGELSEF